MGSGCKPRYVSGGWVRGPGGQALLLSSPLPQTKATGLLWEAGGHQCCLAPWLLPLAPPVRRKKADSPICLQSLLKDFLRVREGVRVGPWPISLCSLRGEQKTQWPAQWGFNCFIHSFSKYLGSAYYVPGTVSGPVYSDGYYL